METEPTRRVEQGRQAVAEQRTLPAANLIIAADDKLIVFGRFVANVIVCPSDFIEEMGATRSRSARNQAHRVSLRQ